MTDKKDKLVYESVQTIEGLEYQRKRAYVNMGSTDSVDGKMPRALLQMAQEIVSNSVDEALSGFGDEILITIHPDQSMTVSDHGRGLPRDLIEKDGSVVKFGSAIRSFTKPGTSGKFDNTGYKNSGGLNGIGAKGTTALSEWVEVEAQTTKNQHYKFKITYDNWIKNEEPDYKEELKFDKDLGTFTKVTFLPDKRVLASIKWNRKSLCDRYEMASYLVPNVKITLVDEREFDDETEQYWSKSWLSEDGLKDYINTLSEGSKPLKGLKEPIVFEDTIKTPDDFDIEIHGALRWIDNLGAMTQSFVNGIPTIEGGPHLQGALRGINDAIRDYTKDKKKLSLSPSDIQEGLIIALEIKVPEPLMQFEGQTKEKYGSAAALPATKQVVGDALTKWLYDNNESAENLIEKMTESATLREKAVQARKDAKAAREKKKNDKNKLLVSSKLTKAIEKDPKKRELFITEGDSACFVGDTKVRLADGRDLEIKNIVKEFEKGKELYIYSQTNSIEDNDGLYQNMNFQVFPIKWAGKTRANAELIRLYIDNDSYVDCTPDHKFLMIDGTYKMAKDLKPDDGLNTMDNNHKVVKIEKLDKKEDVYDLHVEHTHNFVLSNDVVVHNCGTIIQSRNRNQAVFPIRGKMLNTLDVPLSRILKNEEITTIASVLGAGIGPAFDVEDLQYNKLIIASDSDDDGYHIRCLIITMVHRCLPGLIQNGHLYIAESPLFRLSYYEKGEPFNKYVFTEDEKNKLYAELSKKHKDINVTRFKGLGESNPEDLKFAMVAPETRHLVQVTLNDLASAEKYLRINMGKDAELRRNWVMDNMDFSTDAYENM